ncbi:PepSY-associated TM helix domain-containing protein [Chryseosolibacter indicus]|uniref:PepSY domain-containing protein n=1 Tax=Chryseosolibacter indicus TaxID=2782351 RepID=A0ABS5VUN5_9BACT|nr:PepSY-associated TM helix domain-containing protein [Chryseosolibacter indicus]MBT1704753.1 PepSY domain-containing protein [Chryseosolibacter indicus]
MEKRSYNIFFDLHTVSGIVLSVLLFVIFFAGSFSFFRDEIINWERNDVVSVRKDLSLNVDSALLKLQKKYELKGREITFWRPYNEQRINLYLSASSDTTITQEGGFYYIDSKTYNTSDYTEAYSLGEFLYRLHFFAQIPYPAGYFLSGFAALFLVFVVLTGILVHWKKVFTNFFVFRPRAKLKTIWTDAHTALGTIGLPFQVVYAVTGAFFMINILLVIPNVALLYDGNQEKIYEDLEFEHPSFPFKGQSINGVTSINKYVSETKQRWDNFSVTEVSIANYRDAGMHVSVSGELSHATKFTGLGEVIYKVESDSIVDVKDPYAKTTYLDGVKNYLYRLHYGDYGGYALKITSFSLGLLSCFVVISGVLIWLTARVKKSVPEQKKRFYQTVTRIYLAICLTMFPVTAFSFVMVKLFPDYAGISPQTFIYAVYFLSWLVSSFWFIVAKSNNYIINKYCLITGAILSITVPLVSGLTTQQWFWKSLLNDNVDFVVVDLLWILVSLFSFYAFSRLRIPVETEELVTAVEIE